MLFTAKSVSLGPFILDLGNDYPFTVPDIWNLSVCLNDVLWLFTVGSLLTSRNIIYYVVTAATLGQIYPLTNFRNRFI
jgi:hypothetical protein